MKKKVKISLKWEFLGVSVLPMLILAVIITLYAVNSLQTNMKEEALAGLEDVCHSVDAAYTALDAGDYVLQGDDLMKGTVNVTQNETLIDNFAANSETEVTLFFGDTRRATSLKDASTGEKILGTQASAEVVSKVVDGGEDFSSTSLLINEKNYYAYYIPMKNTDGSVVGMFFAGKPSADIDANIRSKTIAILTITLVLLILAIAIILIVANKITRAVSHAEETLTKLSEGNLSVQINEKLLVRKDELGSMGTSLQTLLNELKNIINNMKKSTDVLSASGQELNELAGETNTTAIDIRHAVDDISKGAVSQSEDIEHATLNVSDMGDSIQKIVTKVKTLRDTSEDMEQAKNEAEAIIKELVESCEHTFNAVNSIENQVRLTDESVTKIQDAISLISSIAEETNLLSLNASIEAARAGEAGKGFAVVASEIQKLAEESNSSASSIAEIIRNLTRESKNTVDAMNKMQEIIENQQEKLQETKAKFDGVSTGIQSSREEIYVIGEDSRNCDKARGVMTDVIQNLSSVSEQNAAATKEIMTPMDELNASMKMLAGKADDLESLALSLEHDMNFFKL
ncbi:MAG: methyl-accepting chemotaxis protein [Lachnospiraceae bacterium]|nr:methyl-accepting chemotaxis protein [Lachnospiraceae bacterium]